LGTFIDVARITTKRKVQEPDDVTDANNDDDEEDVDETGVAWSVMEASVCWPQLKSSRPIEPLQQQF
jgi:hypothetical protein